MADLRQAFTFNFANASVLMIDASPISLEVMTNILSGYGFKRMYRCSDLASGTDIVKTHAIDLLLIDPFAFGEDGYKLVSWLRSEQRGPNANVPVIIVTAYTRVKLITMARQCGADYVIAKPFSTSALLQRILWVASCDGRRGEMMAPEVVNQSGSGLELW